MTYTRFKWKFLSKEPKERSPRGKRMVDTREQFEYVAELYEKALLREKEINSKLRTKVNDLTNKLNRRG